MTAPLVVIGAGGTGGHMFPAAAFADEMKKRGWRVGLMTDERGRKYIEGFAANWIINVQAATLSGKRPDKLIAAALKILSGTKAAKAKLKEEGAQLVAGFGGYPSFPAMRAATQASIPVIIHEQNAVLGRVNRVFAKKAEFIACGFDRLDRLPASAETRKRVVGNPVRAPILEVGEQPYPDIQNDGPVNVLVIGGSQGARLFGEVIPGAITSLAQSLRERINIVQQVRAEQIDEVKALYDAHGVSSDLAPFFSDMPKRLGHAHYVVSRAGASSVTELAVTGRPSLLIPLAIAMDDHQTGNAETLVASEAADLLAEPEFTIDNTRQLLEKRLSDAVSLKTRAAAALSMARKTAASDLADLAEQAASKP